MLAMTEITVAIATDEGLIEVVGWTVPECPGLAATRLPEMPAPSWAITHVRSGRWLCMRAPDDRTAAWALKRLGAVSWDVEVDALTQEHAALADSIGRRLGNIPEVPDLGSLGMDGPMARHYAVTLHLVKLLQTSARHVEVMGPLTQTWDLVVASFAEASGWCHPEAEDWLLARLAKEKPCSR
jgi:hypothetical protein